MNKMRSVLVTFALLTLLPVVVQATIQTQRAQQAISIVVYVTPTPTPVGYEPAKRSSGGFGGIIARWALRPVEPSGHAENMTLDDRTLAVNQGAVKVEASVAPNPNATLLTGSNCQGQSPQTGQCNAWVTSQQAGTTQQYACAYEISVNTSITSWKMEQGLFADFSSGSSTFPGGNLANNTYITSPNATATPFVVYQSDGNTWTVLTTNGGAKTYCVTLTLTIPPTTPAGVYNTNAVYTLFY